MAGESLDDFLEGERSGGAIDSEGSFSLNLQAAARKFALFGQRDRALWTLKLGQGFERLGCTSLELSRDVTTWYLKGCGCRPLDFPALQKSLSTVGLSGAGAAEDFLAVAIGALSVSEGGWEGLVGARWCAEESHLIFGEPAEYQAQPGQQVLILEFPKGQAPSLPIPTWKKSFVYSRMAVYHQDIMRPRVHLNDHLSADVMREEEPVWLEYLSRGTKVDLNLASAGGTVTSLGSPVPTSDIAFCSKMRWHGPGPEGEPSCVIMVRDGAVGATQIHPVVAGCFLEPITTTKLAPGMKIVVNGDSCPTDLGYTKLREGPDLDALIESCREPALRSINLLLEHVNTETESVVAKPKTPIVADAAPGCMGCFSLCGLFLLTSEPVSALIFTGVMGAPPGLYFWYSRSQRTKEFTVLKRATDKVLRERRYTLLEGKP